MNEENSRLIDLTDEETGETITFEHLDSVEYNSESYFVMTEYDEDEAQDDEKEFDVYVMKVVTDENGEEALEIVEDGETINNVYSSFKAHAQDEFEFLD